MHFTLKQLALVDGQDSPTFNRITELATMLLGTPVSLVSIVDHKNDRQFFASHVGLSEPWAERQQTPLSHSFCQYVVADNTVLVVENAKEHPRVKSNLAVPQLGVAAYLGAPVHNTQGDPLGALCVIDNEPRTWSAYDIQVLESLASCITESIKLREANLYSDVLLKEQVQFIYSISHDFKSPVNTLHLLTSELSRQWQSGEISGPDLFLRQSVRTIKRMSTMIEDTLAYTQILLNTETTAVSVSLEDIVANVVDNLSGALLSCGGNVSVGTLPTIHTSPNLVQTLFQNLLSNAVKFQKRGTPPHISIVHDSNPSDHYHRIVVADNGIGISEKYHHQIFTLFARLHTRNEYAGTGLGLTMCKRIVDDLGGRLDVESTVNEGSSFIIYLPKNEHDNNSS